MIVLSLIKIVSPHLIITKNTITKSFNPKNLIFAVAFLKVIIVNTINSGYVIYFAVPAGLTMLFCGIKRLNSIQQIILLIHLTKHLQL